MPAIPTFEPSVIVVGDSVAWTKSFPDYPATAGWTLSYSFQIPGSIEDPITFNAVSAGANYSISQTPTETALWVPGNYTWTSFVDNGIDRHTVGTGSISLVPNPSEPFGATHASRTLHLIELAIEGRIPAQLEQTTIAGQSILRIPLSQLMDLRLKYQAEVRAEQDRVRVATGQGSRRTMLARFRRAQ